MCDHLHEQTSRYDADAKLLTFVLVCPTCQTEQIFETLSYEPRFKPCALPGRERPSLFHPPAATEPLRLAA